MWDRGGRMRHQGCYCHYRHHRTISLLSHGPGHTSCHRDRSWLAAAATEYLLPLPLPLPLLLLSGSACCWCCDRLSPWQEGQVRRPLLSLASWPLQLCQAAAALSQPFVRVNNRFRPHELFHKIQKTPASHHLQVRADREVVRGSRVGDVFPWAQGHV
jgi:hypothetical protein